MSTHWVPPMRERTLLQMPWVLCIWAPSPARLLHRRPRCMHHHASKDCHVLLLPACGTVRYSSSQRPSAWRRDRARLWTVKHTRCLEWSKMECCCALLIYLLQYPLWNLATSNHLSVMGATLDPPMSGYLGIIRNYSSPMAHNQGIVSSMPNHIQNN